MKNVLEFKSKGKERQAAVFVADTLDSLRDLSEDARSALGYNIDLLQQGRNPDNWKPVPQIGPGVREIRVKVASGTYRGLYFQGKGKEIHVLNVYRKKDNAMRDGIKRVAVQRFKQVVA